MLRTLALFALIVCLVAATAQADSPFFKQLKSDYATLDQDLLNNLGETGPVKDFVYHKDVATITLKEGTIFFLRYINDRPTTAIFVGNGHISVDIPSHVERQSLLFASRDSVVDQDFEVTFIRMGDDFDLAVRKTTKLEKRQLGWKDFTIAKQNQGEFHFKPVIQHRYDNYFQLLRSVYDRKVDGYFFIDFGRYDFTYDPNSPEEVAVAYEHEGGDQVLTEGAIMQKKERAIYDDLKMSDISFPTTTIAREATLDLGGLEGTTINKARTDFKIVVNSDRTRFLTLFLHYQLSLDSMMLNGKPAEFMRRRDFNFVGAVLPNPVNKGDTITLTLWYHGSRYLNPLPYLDNPAAGTVKLNVTAPSEFIYVFPGMSKVETRGGKQKFTVEPDQKFDQFMFRPYAKGFDTITVENSVNLPLLMLKSPQITKGKYECFISDEMFRTVTKEGIEFIAARLGNPPGTFDETVCPVPEVANFTMPGWIEIPQVHCLVAGDGQFQIAAGPQIAKQWFGSLMQPASQREGWLSDAVCEYLGLMFVQNSLGNGAFYSELMRRKNDFIHTYAQRNNDRPLATGDRVTDSLRTTKGAWVIHMLRQTMATFDKDAQSDASFRKFLIELASFVNSRSFTNADIQRIAEKYYGQKLDWFFNDWLYCMNIPQFDVKYSVAQEGADWFVDGTVMTKGVDASFQMPVSMRVVKEDGSTEVARPMVKAGSGTFKLGPYASKPKEFKFNEFFSVLSQDNVSEGKK
jgi:hypothetical protein